MEKIKLFLVLLSIGLLLVSCDKHSLIDGETSRESVTLKTKNIEKNYQIIDGILHVDSLEVLSRLVDSLGKMSDEELFE